MSPPEAAFAILSCNHDRSSLVALTSRSAESLSDPCPITIGVKLVAVDNREGKKAKIRHFERTLRSTIFSTVASTVPFNYLMQLLTVPVCVGDTETRFIFDTGIGVNLVCDSLARAVGAAPSGSVFTGRRMSGQEVTMPTGTLDPSGWGPPQPGRPGRDLRYERDGGDVPGDHLQPWLADG
jgi:hypothetical protein